MKTSEKPCHNAPWRRTVYQSRHKGYSPEILVLGKSRHSPSCNSNEPNDPSEWLSENPDFEISEFCQNLKRRESARKAFIIADHDQKLRRAWLRRSRPARQLYAPGDWVMFWRHNRVNNQGQWHGPAKIVLTEDQNVLWLTHLSRLYRCAQPRTWWDLYPPGNMISSRTKRNPEHHWHFHPN